MIQPVKSPPKILPITTQVVPVQQTTSPQPKSSLLKLGLWMLLWLSVLDIGVNVLFPMPKQEGFPSDALTRYFHYGSSIESKLNRYVGPTVEQSDPMIASSWLDPQQWSGEPTVPERDGGLLVANYGMSFSSDVGYALAEIDDRVTVRFVGGASAPPSHAFAAYMADTVGRNADVVMLGVLASSVKRMGSVSGLNWTYEHPSPYTYPYYSLTPDNRLQAVMPVITSAQDFVTAFNRQDETWQQMKQQMQQYDRSFDRWVFGHNLSDYSVMLRLLRRGWANRVRSLSEADLYIPGKGFNPDASEIKTLKVMLREFAATARASGQTPVILLLHDQGYSDSLQAVLTEDLSAVDALVLSTHDVVSPDDPKNFIDDGHFTPEANRKLGERLRSMLREERLLLEE